MIAQSIALGSAAGLTHLHAEGVVRCLVRLSVNVLTVLTVVQIHRDIAARNILIDAGNTHCDYATFEIVISFMCADYTAKVADFGMARYVLALRSPST